MISNTKIARTQRRGNLYRSDPLATLLVEKWHLTPLKAGLGSIVIAVILALLTAYVTETLWFPPCHTGLLQNQVPPCHTGLLQDQVPWIAAIIINPFIIGYYLWSFKAISRLIQTLDESDVVDIDRAKIDRMSALIYYRKGRNLWAIGSAVCFGLIVCVTQPHLKQSWASSTPLANFVITIDTLVIVYAGTILVLNLIDNIRILHRLLKSKKLNVNPLHPDRCGGLQSLSNYSIKTAYLIAILGFWIGTIGFQYITQGDGQYYWYVGLVVFLYIFLSGACFFGPLLTVHRGMEKAKKELLHKIAGQFEADYAMICNNLGEEAEVLKKKTEKIRELKTFYTLTDEFPVWPFDVQIFRRYLLTVPTPLIVPLIGILQKIGEMLFPNMGH